MKKAIGLDLGDKWTGIAISDSLKMFARPYTTSQTKDLSATLKKLFDTENIDTAVVGYPKTMKGKESDQTRKVIEQQQKLQQQFPAVSWISWDERLSSKRAQSVNSMKKQKKKKSENKLKSHAIAAAFILDSYLTSRTYNM